MLLRQISSELSMELLIVMISMELLLMLISMELLITRETPAFGSISLALRGSGALGATFGCLRRHLWTPSAPPLGRLLRSFEEPAVKEKKKLGCHVGVAAYAAFGGDKKKLGGLRRPKWF